MLALGIFTEVSGNLTTDRGEIKQTGGIPHDEFWQQVDAEYADTERDSPDAIEIIGKPPARHRRKAIEHTLEPTGDDLGLIALSFDLCGWVYAGSVISSPAGTAWC
jgi:hypothetical protein